MSDSSDNTEEFDDDLEYQYNKGNRNDCEDEKRKIMKYTDLEEQQLASFSNEQIFKELKNVKRIATSDLSILSLLRTRETYYKTSFLDFRLRSQTILSPLGYYTRAHRIANATYRIYCGQFSNDGNQFLTAGQDRDIIIYNTHSWLPKQKFYARNIYWTVTDACFLPDGGSVLYTSICNIVNRCIISKDGSETTDASGIQRNCSDSVYETHVMNTDDFDGSFGIWCIKPRADGTEFIAGTSRRSVLVYRLETKRLIAEVKAHSGDVNSLCFLDNNGDSSVFLSSSDDRLIKVWDLRIASDCSTRPQGILVGHTEGIAHMSSRGDGFYIVSNGKDQTTKLWDVRKLLSCETFEVLPRFQRKYRWDYRYEQYPGTDKPYSLACDNSVMTYRGHEVLETLIRCYFSPQATTGQRYIYTGSANGFVHIYDIMDRSIVDCLNDGGRVPVRDVSWHPYEPYICSSSFDGTITLWKHSHIYN